jgi:hypothetical protein
MATQAVSTLSPIVHVPDAAFLPLDEHEPPLV